MPQLRVLVTGASGFVGRHCVKALLSRGFEVHASGRSPSLTDDPNVYCHKADLLDSIQRRDLLRAVKPTHFLHLAWEVRPGIYRESPQNLAWTAATVDLLHQALDSGVVRILGIGTCFEYDVSTGWCREDSTPCRPTTLYGAAKLSAAQAFEQAAQSGAGAAWGRVFFPFGPGESPPRLIPALILAIAEGKPFSCSHGRQLRDFIYIEDLAGAIAAVLDSGIVGVLNLASGEIRSLRSVIETFAARLGGAHHLRFGDRDVQGADAAPLIGADVSRLRDEVGWVSPVGWNAGVERTLDWWRRHNED